jgi:hypothetical protein
MNNQWGGNMFSFRCTKALTKKLGLPVTDNPPPPTTCLGDWYGHVLNLGHQRLMIFISEKSLFPIILHLREHHRLLDAFQHKLADMLIWLDIDVHLISAELEHMQEFQIAPTANRSVLGSLNDFINLSKHSYYYSDSFNLHSTELWLVQVPCKPIDYDSPDRRTAALLSDAYS